MKNIILIFTSLFCFTAFSQEEAVETTPISKTPPLNTNTPEIPLPEVLPVEIEVKETDERIITKKTYPRIIAITSEIK